jgi:hypothetical protein
MPPNELTAHQRDRARFTTAGYARGKLEHADPQTWREMQTFIKEYPREPIVRRLARLAVTPTCRQPSSRARAPRPRRVQRRCGSSSRDGPLPSSDDEPPLDLFDAALLVLGWGRVA